MDRSGEVLERARTQIDRSCYVWGCEGQDLNAQKNVEAFVRGCETTGDRETNVRRVMTRYAKLKNKGIDPILCFDCSGFVYWVMKPFNLVTGRRTAAGYYSQTDHKTRSQLRAGDLLFVWNGSKISHVGIYAGDDIAIHCKGRDVGVISEPISRHGWNRYGELAGMHEDEPVPPEQYVFTRPMKKGSRGQDVVELKLLLIAHGYKDGITVNTAASVNYGSATRTLVTRFQKDNGLKADGIAGRNTITALGGNYEEVIA